MPSLRPMVVTQRRPTRQLHHHHQGVPGLRRPILPGGEPVTLDNVDVRVLRSDEFRWAVIRYLSAPKVIYHADCDLNELAAELRQLADVLEVVKQ